MEFGKKYCHNSPTVDEDKLHNAIVNALNEFGAIRSEVEEGAKELSQMAQEHDVCSGVGILTLQQRLEILAEEQSLLLDKILDDMKNNDLNEQLRVLTEEKQNILAQIEERKQNGIQQAIQTSMAEEIQEFLDKQPMRFAEYDDAMTRRLVERITIVDAERILVKIRDANVEIIQELC